MRKRPRNDGARDRGGFSLVEVMLAMTLLAIGVLALGAVQLQAMTGVRTGRNVTQAAVIAQSEIERLQHVAWGDLAPTAWTAPQPANVNVSAGGATYTQQQYFLSRRITDLIGGQARSVDVRVTWTQDGQPQKSAVFSTIRFNGGT